VVKATDLICGWIISIAFSTGMADRTITAIRGCDRVTAGDAVLCMDTGYWWEAVAAVAAGAGTDAEGCSIAVWQVTGEAILTSLGTTSVDTGIFFIIVRGAVGRRVASGADVVGVNAIGLIVGIGTSGCGEGDRTAVARRDRLDHIDIGGAVGIMALKAAIALVGIHGAVAAGAVEACLQAQVACAGQVRLSRIVTCFTSAICCRIS